MICGAVPRKGRLVEEEPRADADIEVTRTDVALIALQHQRLRAAPEQPAGCHEWIGEVRGTGCFWAVELVTDRAPREPPAPYGGSSATKSALVKACHAEGLLPFVNYNRIHIVPPLNVSTDEINDGLGMLDRALSQVRATSPTV